MRTDPHETRFIVVACVAAILISVVAGLGIALLGRSAGGVDTNPQPSTRVQASGNQHAPVSATVLLTALSPMPRTALRVGQDLKAVVTDANAPVTIPEELERSILVRVATRRFDYAHRAWAIFRVRESGTTTIQASNVPLYGGMLGTSYYVRVVARSRK